MYTHTQTVTRLGKSPISQFIRPFLLIFTLIFVQSTINCIWMKMKFSPPCDKIYFNLMSLTVFKRQAGMKRYQNFWSLVISTQYLSCYFMLQGKSERCILKFNLLPFKWDPKEPSIVTSMLLEQFEKKKKSYTNSLLTDPGTEGVAGRGKGWWQKG